MAVEIWWSPRFHHSYARYTGARQRVLNVVRHALRRREEVSDWYDGKRAMKGVDGLVYELKATEAHRVLLQDQGPRLVLVDVGDHEVTERYARLTAAERRIQVEAAVPAPSYFRPDSSAGLFLEVDEPVENLWAEELGEEWLHCLGPEQQIVKSDLLDELRDFLASHVTKRKTWNGACFVGLVRGGAGTGKTALLLSLALDLVDNGVPVEFRCSPAVQRYLTAHTRVNLAALARGAEAAGKPSVLLVDDPPTVAGLTAAVSEAPGRHLAVIAAFDPLQWREKYLSSSLRQLDSLGRSFELNTCYRQSSALLDLARGMANTINERSSWRVAQGSVDAEREMLRRLQHRYLDGLTAVRSGGRCVVYEAAPADNVRLEADLLRERWDLWDRLPALVILEDRAHGVRLPKQWAKHLVGIKRLTYDIADVGSYKGLDFQAVWLFLNRDYYERIQVGKLGLSKAEWEALRDLHIPLTRAKDTTLVFAV